MVVAGSGGIRTWRAMPEPRPCADPKEEHSRSSSGCGLRDRGVGKQAGAVTVPRAQLGVVHDF